MTNKKQAAPRAQLAITWAMESPEPAPPEPTRPPVIETPKPAPGPNPIEAFLDRCEWRGFSRHTIRSYRTDLTKAQAHMGNLLTADEAQAGLFIEAECRRGLHPGTVGRRINTLRSFYKDARRQHLLTEDPTLSLEAPKKPKRLPKYLKGHEIEAMFKALRSDTKMDLREAAIIATFYYTGMRLSELTNLDAEHVSAGTVRVFGKGSKERELPIGQALRSYLDAWLNAHPWKTGALFTSLGQDAGRLSPEHVREIVKGVFKRAGLGGRGFTPHKLRHTFASRLLNKGLRIDIIQKLLGHAGIVTTQMYAHTEFNDDLRDQMNAIL